MLAAAAVAALTALVVAPAPSYDPWAWLLWGREIAGGTLSTAEGPAFKPLAVAVCALLSVLGSAAPVAWVLVARTGAVLAVWLGFRLGRAAWRRVVAAGVVAAVGVALCGDFAGYAAAGAETGLDDRARAGGRRGVAGGAVRARRWPAASAARCCAWRRGRSCSPPGSCCGGGARRTARCWSRARSPCPRCGSCPSWSAPATCCARARARGCRTPASPRPRPCPRWPRCGRRRRCRCGPCGSARSRALARRPRARRARAAGGWRGSRSWR